MESSVLVDNAVLKELSRFVLVELYVDGPGADKKANARLEVERFGQSTQPLYVVLTPDGREVAQLGGFTRSKAEFLGWLKRAYANAKPAP
jgi:hypothetical protein